MRSPALKFCPGIVATPGTCSGEPRIDGTRVTVVAVCQVFDSGVSVHDLRTWFVGRLTRDQVEAAIRFGRLNPRWIERELKRARR